MNRKLKFRSAHYHNDTNEFTHFSFWGLIDHRGNTAKNVFASPSCTNFSRRKSEDQYTGLKDKNGKEIYEGDIIDMCGTGDKFQIVWKGMGLWFMNVKTNELYVFDASVYQYEVIGNIHENPELI